MKPRKLKVNHIMSGIPMIKKPKIKESTKALLLPAEEYIAEYGDFPTLDLGLDIERAIRKAYKRGYRQGYASAVKDRFHKLR